MNYAKCWQGAGDEHKDDDLEHQLSVGRLRLETVPKADRVDVALCDKSKPKECDYKSTEQNRPERNTQLACGCGRAMPPLEQSAASEWQRR